MPTTAKRFCAFLSVLVFFELISASLHLITQPTFGVVQLCACLFWVALGLLTFRGSEGARKVLVFLTCLGLGGALLGTFGGVVGLGVTGEVAFVIPIMLGLLSVVLAGGLLSAAGDDTFRQWIRYRAYERANIRDARA